MSGLTYAYARRSFKGFLEGTGKSTHTIASYLNDLKTFETFLNEKLASKAVDLAAVTLDDLKSYQRYLVKEGMTTNTRRRKVLTVRRLFRYLVKRKKLGSDFSLHLPAPQKVERVPETLDYPEFRSKILLLPQESPIQIRNKALLLFLLETGCQVSEVGALRRRDIEPGSVQVGIKEKRKVSISRELEKLIELIERDDRANERVFLGFNRFGSLGSAVSSRGVEVLVKAFREQLEAPNLTPRLFRHTAVKFWLKQGQSQQVVQERLGLKSDYAFRSYAPFLSSN